MEVELWLDKLSQGIKHDNVESTYQKGDLWCLKKIVEGESVVYKYPIQNIFCIKESSFKKSHKEV